MKVAYILSQNSGGLPHYAAELANAVRRHADVVVLKPSETTADDVFADDLDIIDAFDPMWMSIPELYKRNFRVIDNLRALSSYHRLGVLDEIEPDVVHDPTGFLPQTRLFSGLYGIDERYPLVVTYHEIPPDTFSTFRSISTEELFSALFYDAIETVLPRVTLAKRIVHSEKQRRALVQRGVSPLEIEVIPHGVYEFFGRYEYEAAPEEDDRLLFFGNVIPAKGIDTLVRSIPLVAEEIPDVTLVVAGNGRVPKRSRSIIATHDQHFEVHNRFVPNEEVGTFFSRAQVVVLPYNHQGGETKGHSGVLSTALSFGKPVVTTTIGDFPTLVEDTGCGVVVPPSDPERLAEAIVCVLRDDDRRARMAENSSRQSEQLSWEKVAHEHVSVYEEAIAGHRARNR